MYAKRHGLSLGSVLLWLLLVWIQAQPVAAAEFDVATGRLMLTEGSFSYGFNEPSASMPILGYDSSWTPVLSGDVAARFVDNPGGLEGGGAWHLGGELYHTAIDLTSAADSLDGRRVEIRLWVRPEGTRPLVQLAWYTNRYLSLVTLSPTPRGTSDGWRELTTGPIDFSLGGLIPASFLILSDTHVDGATGIIGVTNPLRFDPEARAAIDAFEIIDMGPQGVPTSTCTVLDEDDSCGVHGLCFLGQCTDAAAVLGPVPASPEMLEEYLSRRIFEIEHIEGIRSSQLQADELIMRLESLEDPEEAKQLWPALSEVWEGLHDGHAYPPSLTYRDPIGIGLCLGFGEADLLPNGESGPMVFSAASGHPIAGRLAPGDVLRRVDGVDVEDWVQEAEHLLYYPGDPGSRQAILATQILDAALITGAVLEFERCTRGGPNPCGPDEVETLVVDLATEVGHSLWSGSGSDEFEHFPVCDMRFSRSVTGPDVAAHHFVGFTDVDGVRVIQWNGFPNETSPEFAPWEAIMNEALDDSPEFVLLDERLGGGGRTEGWTVMFAHLLSDDDVLISHFLPLLSPEIDETLFDVLFACGGSGIQDASCGGYMLYAPPGAGSPRSCAESRVAVLTGQDVSGNDFFTRYMVARGAPTRIFGTGPTYGGYGAVMGLSTHQIGMGGPRIQRQDTFFTTAYAFPDEPVFESGFGVWPDELVMQRQSDAMDGRDTMIESAINWLQGE